MEGKAMIDAEIVAALKAKADAAWAESHIRAVMADSGICAPSEFYAALERAREASRLYQALCEP
jgi:hypothetical protein